MGDTNRAWIKHSALRDFRRQPQPFCKGQAISVYVLQLYLRIHSSFYNKEVGGYQLIRNFNAYIFVHFGVLIQRNLITTLLQFDTKYYYAVGTEQTMRKFWFRTPPKSGPDVPYTFGLIGIIKFVAQLCIYIC